MGRSRSLTRVGALLKQAALGATESKAANSTSAVADASSYVAKRSFSSVPSFRTNVLGGQYSANV